MTDKITTTHGYIDPALQRLTKPGPSGRPVLDTLMAVAELRYAGYDAFELGGEVYYHTAQKLGNHRVAANYYVIHGKPALRVYGPNTVIALVNQRDKNPDAKLCGPMTYRQTTTMTCPHCGEAGMTVDGEWATGIMLPTGYTPQPGELVKNHWMECAACGFAQAS